MIVKETPAIDPPPDVEITLSHDEAVILARVLYGSSVQANIYFHELYDCLPGDIRDLAACSSSEAIEQARLG